MWHLRCIVDELLAERYLTLLCWPVSVATTVAPVIFESPRFALKGGTALNLFVQD
jgi:hypothetical protein